ncbi:hypothetical protein MLD63_12390 [Paracoccus sp. TK19116]|uniref:Uncharacterized protein n=1 Tax=Paracoccus albicereus TaxID=2922394 RepID=A0ABT1MSC8_9RHOB|nr:hypothetical protein [Paracoccus albicereus]MCQ0971220.1 hypothetical protein [Paracoccus albicereus]
MFRFATIAVMLCALSACGAPPGEGDKRAATLAAHPALTAAFLTGTTLKLFSPPVGTEYYYLAPDGRVVLAQPRRDRAMRGRWIIRPSNSFGAQLCLFIPGAREPLIADDAHREWNCASVDRLLPQADEIYDGDVLGLAGMTALPRQLPPRLNVPVAQALREIGRTSGLGPNKAVAFD